MLGVKSTPHLRAMNCTVLVKPSLNMDVARLMESPEILRQTITAILVSTNVRIELLDNFYPGCPRFLVKLGFRITSVANFMYDNSCFAF